MSRDGRADSVLLHNRHFRHPWRSYAAVQGRKEAVYAQGWTVCRGCKDAKKRYMSRYVVLNPRLEPRGQIVHD
jgi:hypothetical protein